MAPMVAYHWTEESDESRRRGALRDGVRQLLNHPAVAPHAAQVGTSVSDAEAMLPLLRPEALRWVADQAHVLATALADTEQPRLGTLTRSIRLLFTDLMREDRNGSAVSDRLS